MNTPVSAETVPMDARTLKALQGSIAKWEKIVAGTGFNSGAFNCPLCQQFNSHLISESHVGTAICTGCPVQIATGEHGCRGSPYEEYERREDDEDLNSLDSLRPLAQRNSTS